jgi:class 3 adenylate cyclase/tetratricopeptide (TPR) repeat protein
VTPEPEQATVDCPTCGSVAPADQRHCGTCGTALSAADEHELRRDVTIVTSDLKGSTALGERLDPESLREVMTTYIDEMRAVFEGNGGTIEKIIGDAIVAVFGLPTAREDDALRAVEAAAESQRALASLNDVLEERWGVRLTVRTGVASGEVVVGEARAGQHVLTGPTLAVATLMEQNAPAQEVLLADSTYQALRDAVEVEPMGPVQPKGGGEAVETYRLISVTERPSAAPAGPEGAGRTCHVCGDENPTEYRFCRSCGSELRAHVVARDTRKTVTVVFADPKPTTADGSPIPAEVLRDVMSRYFAAMQGALEGHGATVEKFIGDAVMAVFGLPIRHEDDALRAVRAASDMQRALPELNRAFEAEHGVLLQNHIGVNTGEVVAGDASLGQRLVTGDTVNVAARLEQAAGAREILLGDLTYRLVRDAVQVEAVEPLTLKGKSEPVPAYRLLKVSDVGEALKRRQDTPMVGREEEMAALDGLLGTAVGDRVCRMATVVGDAGVGKTRLIREFTSAAADEALVIRGRCLPYGDGITFWPLREAVREAAGIGTDDGMDAAFERLRARVPEEAVVDRLASVMGLSEQSFPVAEVFWGARRFLEALAGERPVVMVIDDLHWAEATFLDLVKHLVEAVEAPVLLLCTSRHELLERQPEWAQDAGSLRLVLAPLSDADAGRIIAGLLGGTEIDESVQGRIVEAAAGNPLFVEQLLSMLLDEGALIREQDRWVQVGDLSHLDVPPTIQALLAARLDLLDQEERGVIEPASVVGQNFPVAAVTDLVAEPIAPSVPAHLVALTQKQLVQPNEQTTDEDVGYRFHHLLVRDAAYNGLLKRERAELHERFVAWALGYNAAHGLDNREFEEIHGYHLEQAYLYLTELGRVDEHAVEVGVRASEKLASAGRRAMARGDMPAAASLLRRAAATRLTDDVERVRLLPDLGEALEELGQFDEAQKVLEEAIAWGREHGDDALAADAMMVLLSVKLYLGEEDGWAESVQREVAAAIPIFERADDDAGLARANRLLFAMHASAMRLGEASRAAEQVIERARHAGDGRIERRGSLAYVQAALYGPTPVDEAIAETERLVAAAEGDRRTQGLITTWLAQLYAMRGDLEGARSTYAAGSAMLAELGEGDASLLRPSTEQAQIELVGGNLALAEAGLRQDADALRAMGEKYILSGVVGTLAKVLVSQGRVAEIAGLVDELSDLAAPDDVVAQVEWRGFRSLVLAEDGRLDEAERLAHEAVEMADGTDAPVLQAEALLRLSAVLRAAGRVADANAAHEKALDRYRAKGHVVPELVWLEG